MEHLFGSEEFPCFTLGCEESACHMSNFSVTLSQSTVRQTRNRTWIEFAGEHGKTLVLAVATTARANFRAAHF